MLNSLLQFETGQVYSVLIQEESGCFYCLGRKKNVAFADMVAKSKNKEGDQLKDQNILLVYVVTQEVLYNDEPSTITYFRDITFGILFEQMTTKMEMQAKISKILQQKVALPIHRVIESLHKFDKNNRDKDKISDNESARSKSMNSHHTKNNQSQELKA